MSNIIAEGSTYVTTKTFRDSKKYPQGFLLVELNALGTANEPYYTALVTHETIALNAFHGFVIDDGDIALRVN